MVLPIDLWGDKIGIDSQEPPKSLERPYPLTSKILRRDQEHSLGGEVFEVLLYLHGVPADIGVDWVME
jgi:hypothetical protein